MQARRVLLSVLAVVGVLAATVVLSLVAVSPVPAGADPAPAVTSSLPPNAAVGVPYSHTFTSGVPNATWSVTSGTLPAGLALDPVTGVLSGTPTTPGASGPITVQAASGFTQVDGGGESPYTVRSHSCAVRAADGSVDCWGNNDYGQAEDQVGPYTQVATGAQHSCAIREADGSVDCWGSNDGGKATDQVGPYTQITADWNTTCGILASNGSADCWGPDYYGWGQVADQVGPFDQISAGPHFNCGVRSVDGAVDCWGWGQAPGVPIDQVGPYTQVSAGWYHACGILESDGSIDCWGSNDSGESVDQAGPFSEVSVGYAFSCGTLAADGSVKCWGLNENGQATDQAGPVSGLAAGSSHVCAISDADGSVGCWGRNASGESAGAAATTASQTFSMSTELVATPETSISVSGFTSCALTPAGGVQCWGANGNGRVGSGSMSPGSVLTRTNVAGLTSGVAAVSTGQTHSCALTTLGAVKCWGANVNGALGDGTTTDSATPVDVVGLSSGVVSIAAGAQFTCAVTGDGAVKCWGWNPYGIPAPGTVAQSHTPVDVPGFSSGIRSMTAGTFHACGLTDSGSVECWGSNGAGQLGDGTTTDSMEPVEVIGISGASTVSAGAGHTCAITGGAATCWGFNDRGRLGDGTTTNSSVPVDVVGMSSGVTSIGAGWNHSCAVQNGAAKCWGANNGPGQLGDGNWDNSSVPVGVVGFSSGAAAVSAGQGHSCGLSDAGTVRCWGDSTYGQVGNGTDGYSLESASANVAPQAGNPSFTVARGATKSFTLTGTDPEGDALTFAGTSSPARGTLACGTPTAADCTYTAPTNSSGDASFTYTVSDGIAEPVTGTVTITVSSPRVAVGDVQVAEAETGTASLFVPITLSSPVANDVLVDFYTVHGTTTNTDYQRTGTASSPVRIRIPAGMTWNTIGIPVFADAITEPDETFTVHITKVTSADPVVIGDADGEVTIYDVIQAVDDPVVSVTPSMIWEGDIGRQRGQFIVRLSHASTVPVDITIYTVDGTATAGSDYGVILPRTITIPAGKRQAIVDDGILGDFAVEGIESFDLRAVPASGAPVIQGDVGGTMYILDDDA